MDVLREALFWERDQVTTRHWMTKERRILYHHKRNSFVFETQGHKIETGILYHRVIIGICMRKSGERTIMNAGIRGLLVIESEQCRPC
ncbi:hypothetical protein Slip_0463 [Syntrophothermus lipocalidus DSM 12680]|uniref:Uncharacterized protein n=1 Tax=Syntrophothermus lipocalidus (strain DSM 12680 / TGB-C1) TaxID=643648 RepID=D7CKL2_SYNLT|nr:hypothetical protein Slip_0463 [Syntrophothermus lipocalidus DSM 12680]